MPTESALSEESTPLANADQENRPKRTTPLPSLSEKKRNVGELTLTTFFIVFIASSWALSTQFAKHALNTDTRNFFAPYFLMWYNTCHMLLCYPLYLLFAHFAMKKSFVEANSEAMQIFPGDDFFMWRIVKKVSPFLLFWTLANYSSARALGSISPSVSTAIHSSNTAAVYLLAILVLKDKLYLYKVISVILAITGVTIMSIDGQISAHPVGVALALVSAASAAFYKVFFKKIIGSASFAQVSLFMSTLGFLNVLLNTVPAFGLLYTPWEWANFSSLPWIPLGAVAFCSLLFNFTINLGIALVNPLAISIGMLFGIPLNAAFDLMFRADVKGTVFFVSGTCLILASCILITLTPPIVERFVKKLRCSMRQRDVELTTTSSA